MAVGVELVFVDFAAEGIAVNAQDDGGARLIAVGAFEDALDEFFFELADGFVEQNAALHHLCDKPFQLIFHDDTLRNLQFEKGP